MWYTIAVNIEARIASPQLIEGRIGPHSPVIVLALFHCCGIAPCMRPARSGAPRW